MFWLQAIPAAIYFLALLCIPESPRFLVAKGRDAEAHAVLDPAVRRRRGRPQGRRDPRPRWPPITTSPSSRDLLDKPPARSARSSGPVIGLAVFQQLVGINVVFYYGATLWQAVGFTENDALQINILSGVLSIVRLPVHDRGRSTRSAASRCC